LTGFNLGKFIDAGAPISKLEILRDRVKKLQQGFQMWGLSIMFLGMNIQRTFTQIARSTTSTFIKIMESSGWAGSAIQQLNVHFEYLKFVIGSAISRALEPLMPIIIKVINWISRWVQEHPKLTSAIVLGGIALGAFLFTVGQLVISIGPLITLISKMIGLLGGTTGLVALLIAIPTIITIAFVVTKGVEELDAIIEKIPVLKDKVKENLLEVSTSFSGYIGAVKGFFSSIIDMMFPELEKSTGKYGILVAWISEVMLKSTSAMLNNWSSLTKSIEAAGWAAKAFSQFSMLDFKGAGESLKKSGSALVESYKFGELSSSFGREALSTFLKGPAAYENMLLSLQAQKDVSNIPLGSGYGAITPYERMAAEQSKGITVNIANFNANGMTFEESLKEFSRKITSRQFSIA
jgi:hypothetical protein